MRTTVSQENYLVYQGMDDKHAADRERQSQGKAMLSFQFPRRGRRGGWRQESDVARLAALRGIGVSQSPTLVVADDLESGRLVDLFLEWSPKAGIIHALFPSRRGLLPSVRAVLDFLAAEYAAIDGAGTAGAR
jgi:DNA-binding transcriptional LysR family regulator